MRSWLEAMPLWLGKKLHIPKVVRKEIGYDGDISIEHEDPVFGGEKTDEGLRLGCDFLRQFIEK